MTCLYLCIVETNKQSNNKQIKAKQNGKENKQKCKAYLSGSLVYE